MEEKVSTKNGFKGVLDWLYIHRLIVIILGVILLALIVVIVLYASIFSNTSKISFTTRSEDAKLEYVSDFTTLDKINEFDLSYDFTKQKKVNGDKAGYYTFKFTTQKTSSTIDYIRVTALVHSNWVKDYDYLSSQSTLPINAIQATSLDITVNYDKALPKMPMLFVFLKHPSVYFKIELKYKENPDIKYFYLEDTKILGTTPTLGFEPNN
ncbi:MAG: hypothetical protein LBV55_03805 [Acholeplasmatales bacterium]|jgi:cytochrome c-type biogenesis protein CcmE|nr:hypothetical protein [Acholeplasmatales bacterium]